MKKSLLLIGILALFIVSCTPGPNYLENTSTDLIEPAGFFLGLWHGFISMFTFIISLFNNDIGMYEVYNNGTWYNLGFLIGVSAFFGGSGGGACKRSKRK